jgi:hypothetical protein
MRPCTALLVALAAFASFGCGRIREVRECRELARLVNPALDEIAARVEKERGAAPYRFAATRYAKLSGELQHFRLGIPRAQRTLGELSATMKEASSQATKLADALDKGDAVVAANVRRDLGHLARQQKSITMRIHGDCSGS